MPNAPPPTAPSSGNGPPLPAAVRNWLVARYLSDPTPGPVFDNDPEPIVFVRYDTFADYLVSAGYELLPNLDTWKDAGWIHDVMVDLTPSSDPNASPPYAIARLNLPFGRLRLVGIRQAVLTAPTEPAPATGPCAAPTAVHGPAPKKARNTLAITRELVSGYLLKRAKSDPWLTTVARIVTATGASTGAVQETPEWRAFHAERKRRRGGTVRSVPLTDGMTAVIPARTLAQERELAKLVLSQDDHDDDHPAVRERSRRR